MQRQIIITSDGSPTISIPSMDVTYHSHHGAIQESQHVCIDAGFTYILEKSTAQPIVIFEMGFGTGLNALLSLIEAEKSQRTIHYITTELFPLEEELYTQLNYCHVIQRPDLEPAFQKMHQCAWEKDILITPGFTLHKIPGDMQHLKTPHLFNLVYFDAFSPVAQPLLWTTDIFSSLYKHMHTGAALVTYCSKSIVRKAMQQAGLTVYKIQGPWGKREMVRAIKI